MRNSFYWCYTPNSGDTGGILDDNLIVRQDKLSLLNRLWGTTGVTPPATTPPPVTPPVVTPPVVTPPVVTPPVVTPPVTTVKQQNIASFSPSTGPVGTAVTINGSGFTGTTLAWVGSAHNGVVTVLSDTQVRLTIPAGATSGAIGIFNAKFAAFTAIAFTVTATVSYAQPVITNFAPGSGPVGTVVTINGIGFTGSNSAWVGVAHNGVVKVLSDTQMQVTIPAGATTGAIGIFNPAFAAFTATAFSVSAIVVTNPQPGIMNFSPGSGKVGTIVTVNGSGFTGANLAWVGVAHNGAVKVLSDSQMQVTIPSGATTGAIGIFNPTRAAFSATSFTVM